MNWIARPAFSKVKTVRYSKSFAILLSYQNSETADRQIKKKRLKKIMAILATAKGTFTPAPEGVFQAVCVDVIDLGVIFSEKFQTSANKIDIVFQINQINPETGKRFLIRNRVTLSLSPKATLRTFLEAWRGKVFTKEDLEKGFDVEKLVGANAQISIVHNGDWANIKAIMPLVQGMAKIDAFNYVREAPKTTTVNQPAPVAQMTATNSEIPTADDDDCPF